MDSGMAAAVQGQASDCGSWAPSSPLVLVIVKECFTITKLRYLIICKFKFLSISLEAEKWHSLLPGRRTLRPITHLCLYSYLLFTGRCD